MVPRREPGLLVAFRSLSGSAGSCDTTIATRLIIRMNGRKILGGEKMQVFFARFVSLKTDSI